MKNCQKSLAENRGSSTFHPEKAGRNFTLLGKALAVKSVKLAPQRLTENQVVALANPPHLSE